MFFYSLAILNLFLRFDIHWLKYSTLLNYFNGGLFLAQKSIYIHLLYK